jgi:translation initiation factor 1A
MVSKIGGKKKKRSANSSFQNSFKRDMVLKEIDQEYGYVDKVLGDMRCNVIIKDKSEVICRICGSFRRRVWINTGDVVLISLRSFENKGDIIYKYNTEEAEYLKSIGELKMEEDNEPTVSFDTMESNSEVEEEIDLETL